MTSHVLRLSTVSAVLAVCVVLSGCGSAARGPYASTGEQVRDSVKAEKSYREAVENLTDDPKKAEELLRTALGFDLYHGAAHNNLGVLLLKQGRLYDAAEEFEWARKLMPGHPEPRVNLAITLDRGGKFTDAIEAAKTALEIAPGNLIAMQVVAMVQVREGMTDAGTVGYLDQISQRGESDWSTWAQRVRLRIGTDVDRQ